MINSKNKKIAIVWANPYNSNLGVGALAYSALALLHDIAKDNNIEAEFSFFGSSKNERDAIIINGQLIHFDNIKGINFFSWKSVVKLLFFTKRTKTKYINGFDYIYDIAEGDSFTDIYGAERFWLILNSKKYFLNRKKPQVLLPQTIGPFKDLKHEKAAFDVMKKLNLVISRDKQSFDYTAKFLPKEKIVEAIDVAFYLPFNRNEFDNEKIHVGVNISGLLWNGGYTRNNQFGMKTDYKKLIWDTIEFFSKEKNVQIHIVSHVVPNDGSVEDDVAAGKAIQRKFTNVVLSPVFATPIEAKSYISGLDFFTGARMHACIAAFSSGVPVFPMAYSRKFNGLFTDTLKYEWLGDCVNETGDIVLVKLKSAFTDRERLGEAIEYANTNIVSARLKQLKQVLHQSLINA